MAGSGEKQQLNMVAVKYVLTCLANSRLVKADPELEREVRTIAEALDMLVSGKLASLGDLLMQRFKSLEMRLVSGDQVLAKHIQLLPEENFSTTTLMEREMAAGMERRELKLVQLQKKFS